ncbi:MAG: hypothetical protein KGQ60_10185, partial [Planctomycetes bacterium]|nr:hypothetical protein [Planctomycetota bacterium]
PIDPSCGHPAAIKTRARTSNPSHHDRKITSDNVSYVRLYRIFIKEFAGLRKKRSNGNNPRSRPPTT